MKFSYLLLSLLIIPMIVNSQDSQISTSRDSGGNIFLKTSDIKVNQFGDHTNFVDTDAIKGSQYFNENFLLGTVFINNKPVKEKYAVRYNAFKDEIEVQKENEVESLLKAVNISCSIMGQLYIYQKYLPRKSSTKKLGYLKVLLEGKTVSLLKQEYIRYKEAKPARTSLTIPIPAKFVQFENYYFLNNGEDTAIQLTKKTVLNAFNDSLKSKMKSFIKKEKIDLKKESDVRKLFTYYDSLVNDLN
jgi:hypothetical protein